ncbi:hypothetical protein V6N13_007824 [Hibiscus sabdariffa]
MSPGAVLAWCGWLHPHVTTVRADFALISRWASAILGGFPPRYASPDWVWHPIHGACSLQLMPCTTGALAPLFAPARNALDAALALSRLGLPRCFHWLFHSLGKPLDPEHDSYDPWSTLPLPICLRMLS